jgi:hypothetical protein
MTIPERQAVLIIAFCILAALVVVLRILNARLVYRLIRDPHSAKQKPRPKPGLSWHATVLPNISKI